MPKVLVVDDDPDIRRLLDLRLRSKGHQVISAGSADEALQILAEHEPPDVAVLDVLMPGRTGLELLAELRRDPAYADMSAVFLSGRVQDGDIAAGRALNATYLTKPVVISALLVAIDRALEAHKAAVPARGW